MAPKAIVTFGCSGRLVVVVNTMTYTDLDYGHRVMKCRLSKVENIHLGGSVIVF